MFDWRLGAIAFFDQQSKINKQQFIT